MKKGDAKNRRGFTIIEVSLVLAIAGLIFLMVFVALPSLQRGQRDARRREDVMTFLEELKTYQQNNRGALPDLSGTVVVTGKNGVTGSSWQGFYNQYLDDDFADPDGSTYTLRVSRCNTSDCDAPDLSSMAMDHVLYVFVQSTCNGERPERTSNPRNVSVLYRLEGSGVYCNNS